MLNKIQKFAFFTLIAGFMIGVTSFAVAADDIDVEMEDLSAAAVADYQVEGSLFQQITDLEQEKVLMQLEKERAQLDLDLDRLAAEKIKLHMEIDALSGRAEAQQQELETEMAKLEAEAARLAQEKESLAKASEVAAVSPKTAQGAKSVDMDTKMAERFKLVNVVGAGAQLQATIADLKTGQNKRISVGKSLDGWVVKSISLDEGIVFTKDGETQTLNVINGK